MIEYNKRNARIWSLMGINPAIWSVGFADVIKKHNKTALLTADLARYSGLMRTFTSHPEMCYNFGIAEQNMVSAGAGMAMEGLQVWMTTYAPFMTLRCADQVRHLMGNLNLNMKAIGSAAGLSAGLSGSSLLAINDIALMRSIPNIVVLCPADTMEAVKMVCAMAEINSPCYMRFCGAVNIPIVYTADYDFQIGKAVELRKGEKIAIIATGSDLVYNSVMVANTIKESIGQEIGVYNFHTIKPLDTVCLDKICEQYDNIVTIEEHNILGGLGSAVAEYLVTKNSSVKQTFIGIEDKNYIMGARQFMLEQAGLTVDKIIEKINNL
jgi:transketolase